VVGNVGARERINYTLVGAVANQARAGGPQQGLRHRHPGERRGGEADGRALRLAPHRSGRGGRHTEALDIYEPLGELASAADHAEFLDLWRTAHDAYDKGCFEEALAGFKAAQAQRPDDAPCRIFIDRCTDLVRAGLPEGWDGAWHFDRK
jgi:hypothetical protein